MTIEEETTNSIKSSSEATVSTGNECGRCSGDSSAAFPMIAASITSYVTFAPLSTNRYHKRKGRWLNKSELYYSKADLKEIRQEATVLAKHIESELSSPQALRGYEGLATKALQLKSERRKRARDVVLGGQRQEQDAETLASKYAEVVSEAIMAALQVAEGDADEARKIQADPKLMQEEKELQQKQQTTEEHLPSSTSSHQVPAITTLHTSVIQALVATQPPQKTVLRVHNSSLHMDGTLSASSSVCSDDFLSKDNAPTQTKKKTLKKVISSFGKRLLRSKSIVSTSIASVDTTWKQ